MGQQQLLIIILVTIVIGISMIVAVNTFESAAESANRDAVIIDMTTLASESQQYYINPTALGGGGRSFNGFRIEGKILPVMGIDTEREAAQNENGTFEIIDVEGQEFTIVGHPSECEGYQPGTIDENGLLSSYGVCSEENRIIATVGPNRIDFE